MGKVIIAIVKGGLGNQLFIYAAARALALRTGRDLYLDMKRGYEADNYGRSYRLAQFPIQAKVMPESWRVAPTLKHPKHKLVRAWNKLLPRNRRCYLAERHHLNARQLVDLKPSSQRVTLLGYWQDERYFIDVADIIRRELAPVEPLDERNRALGERLVGSESVALHVRRVRYTPLLGPDYYQKAIDQACERVPNPLFVLFGDDPDWAESKLDFRGHSVERVCHNAEVELSDLWLMSRCRHAIIANSSFSWWGGWLGAGARRDGVVWCPASPGLPIRWPSQWVAI